MAKKERTQIYDHVLGKCDCGSFGWIFKIAKIAILILIICLVIRALNPYQSQISTIDNSGTAEMAVMPDKAIVFLGAETDSAAASDSQNSNAAIINSIKSSLASSKDLKIETSSYSVYPVYSYDKQTPQLIGYKTSHILKITTTNINNTGEIVDSASNAGANVVQDIQFSLSSDKEKQARQSLLSGAIADAKEKADIIAKAAHVWLKKPVRITESWNMPYPLMEKAMYGSAAGTSISPQELQLSVSVSISWKI